MKQTIPLYHTTGISGFRIARIRTVARSGKVVEIKDARECQKSVKREGRLSGKGRGGRRQLIISIERRHAVCQDCGSDKARHYKANVRLIRCRGFGRMKAFVEVGVHHIYCPECRSMSYEHLEFLTNPRARVTRALEKDIVERRRKESITDVADDFGVSRRIVRKAEIRALGAWIAEARASDVGHHETMAKTMEKNLDGVLGFWRFRGASNAKTEGFNNKIRWLVRQAYGYRDYRHFRLKIFDLPNLRQRDDDS